MSGRDKVFTSGTVYCVCVPVNGEGASCWNVSAWRPCGVSRAGVDKVGFMVGPQLSFWKRRWALELGVGSRWREQHEEPLLKMIMVSPGKGGGLRVRCSSLVDGRQLTSNLGILH